MAALPPLTQLAGNHGSLFEGYFQQLDATRNGRIDASCAAAFLKKSQLGDPVLHKIWELSDPTGRGYLDKQGFYAALRMLSACQLGKDPSLANITLSDPPPQLVGVDIAALASFTQKKWTIESEDRGRYDKMFQGLHPVAGKLTGEKAKTVMLASKLPVDMLGKIWNLADLDRDGHLDADEFAVAMRLIQLCQAGETLPPSLPPSVIPASKKGGAAGGVVSLPPLLKPSPSPSPIPASTSATNTTPLATPTVKLEWVVTAELKKNYDKYFEGIDKDKDGMVTGEEARGLFMASNLSSNVLAHVWTLCDFQKRGKLNSEQFALAMFLIAEKVRGKELPQELAPNMIPPSLRGKPVSSASKMSNSTSSSSISSMTGTPFATPISTPALLTSTVTSSSAPPPSSTLPTTATASLLPTPLTSTGAPPPSTSTSTAPAPGTATGFSQDFSAIKELDTLANEIEGIKTEKVKLQEDILVKQELIQSRKGEIEGLQGNASQFMKQREDLEREKGQYTTQLEQLDNEKAKMESQIAEMKQKCVQEQEEIERLRQQLGQQESGKRAQSEELERLRVQLETLKKEERDYKQKVESGKLELEKLQKANQSRQSEIREVRHKLDKLKEEQLVLTQQIAMYGTSSTPSSTPSSSVVNINDVGQLAAELHVPHVNEPDAISARATAGSSSPVSSISGFSTNSHLEEPGDDGGREDKTPRIDPFAGSSLGSMATSQPSDPFAAFSVPSGDPLSTSGGAIKPADLLAFDPFGMSNAFNKTTPTSTATGTSGDDIFKSDPFSGPGTNSAATATVSTDPFSGQDPFSSDPFASSGSGPGGSVKPSSTPWTGPSPFGSDPFSGSSGTSPSRGGGQTATTPTDPFASDPFLEDPFGVKGGTEDVNPFASHTSDAFGSGKGWADKTS